MFITMNSKDVLLPYLCDDINKWILRDGNSVIFYYYDKPFEKITDEIHFSKFQNNLSQICFRDKTFQIVQFIFENDDLEIIYIWHKSHWHYIKRDSFDICTFDKLAIYMMNNCLYHCCNKWRDKKYNNKRQLVELDKKYNDKQKLVDLFSKFDVMRYIFCRPNEIIIEI